MIKPVNINSVNSGRNNIKKQPQFKGVLDVAVASLQACEVNPMLNVAVLDLATAIIPRTIIEGETNPYAGFEAFRRESSGLVINCLIPGLIVAGIAKAIQKPIMGKNTKMADCWANEDTIKLVTKHWQEASDETVLDEQGKVLFRGDKARVYRTIERVLSETEGVDGDELKSFKGLPLEDSIRSITESVFDDVSTRSAARSVNSKVSKAYSAIVEQTHASENIRMGGAKEYFSQSLEAVVGSTPKILRELVNGASPEEFATKATKLVTRKSLLGLGVVLPLAMAAQPVNRWITAKASGKKGAPIYKDFTETESKELSSREKVALASQKLVSVSAMAGVALLSIMKKPNKTMFKNVTQFKGIFPSMDQARIIAAATFASRMMASEDKNDLREATFRDIATFSYFYFLGDYVAKGIATVMQNTKSFKDKGIKLINVLEKAPEGGNVLEKAWHWAKHTALKSSDEIYGKTADITKYAKKMRGACQLGNIAFSLIALGLVIPKMYRNKTDKEREKELKEMGVSQETINKYYPSFEMNIKGKNARNTLNSFSNLNK